jgi:hypothetical protein
MANPKVPEIIVGGVPILAQEFRWEFSAGVTPYQTSIAVDNINSSALEAVENPTSISINVTGGVRGDFDSVDIEIRDVWLVEPRRIDDFQTIWTVADTRYSWRGKKLYMNYNKTRQLNKKDTFITAIGDTTNPVTFREPYQQFKAGRYVDYTLKPDGNPWTMFEILEKEFEDAGIKVDFSEAPNDDSYIIENVYYEGMDIYSGLRDLLNRSRLNLGINRNGSAYVFSIDK